MCTKRLDKVSLEFRAPLIPARRYVEENGSVAMLVTKRLAGVTSEVHLRECVTYTPPPGVNKASTLALKPGGDVTRSH